MTGLHPRAPTRCGTGGYRSGHRCDVCRAATLRYHKAYRVWLQRHPNQTRRRPALGTRRRLLSLAWLGYTQRQLAAELGTTQRTITRIVTGQYHSVYPLTEARVMVLFDRLAAEPPPPVTSSSARASAAARRHPDGADPLAWDDDLIDLPLPVGRPRDLDTPQDDAVVFVDEVTQMFDTGRTLLSIAGTYRVTPLAVLRRLERHDAADLARALTGHPALERTAS